MRVTIYFTLLEIRATKIMTWDCHVDNSVKGSYDVILGKDILTALVLNLKFSEHLLESNGGTLKGAISLIVYLDAYEFKDLNTGKLHPKNHL